MALMTYKLSRPTIILIAAYLLFCAAHFSTFIENGFASAFGDAHIRMLRVEQILETFSWQQLWFDRTNVPYGELMPWTIPYDLLVIIGTAPLLEFMPVKQALLLWAGILPLILWGLTLIALAYAARPLNLNIYGWIVMLFSALLHPHFFSVFTPGRVDHHNLLTLVFLLFIGTTVRLAQQPRKHTLALVSGILCGVGVWVSPEFIAPFALALFILMLPWLQYGTDTLSGILRLLLSTFMLLIAALVIEYPPKFWLHAYHDNISIVHVALTMAASAVVLALRFTNHCWNTPTKRLAAAAGFSVPLLVILLVVFPDFYLGPIATLPPALYEEWFSINREFMPTYDRPGTATALFFCLASLLVSISWLRRQPADTKKLLPYLILAAVFSLLLIMQGRWYYYAIAACLPVLGYVTGKTLANNRGGYAKAAFIVMLWPVLSYAIDQNIKHRTTPLLTENSCRKTLRKDIQNGNLDLPSLLQKQPANLLIHPNLAPMTMFFTPHNTISWNHHRSAEALLTATRLFKNKLSADQLKNFAGERQLDFLIFCPSVESKKKGFLTSLAKDESPEWLKPLKSSKPYKIYRFEFN